MQDSPSPSYQIELQVKFRSPQVRILVSFSHTICLNAMEDLIAMFQREPSLLQNKSVNRFFVVYVLDKFSSEFHWDVLSLVYCKVFTAEA